MHAISSYRGNRPTPKHCPLVANKQTGLITIHCAAKLNAQCNKLVRLIADTVCAAANVNKRKDTTHPQGWRWPITKVLPGTGRTDRQTDGRTECNAICGTLLRRRAPHNKPVKQKTIVVMVAAAAAVIVVVVALVLPRQITSFIHFNYWHFCMRRMITCILFNICNLKY